MRRLSWFCLIVVATWSAAAGGQNADSGCHGLRRRTRHRRRRPRADRERVVRRQRRALRAGRPGGRRARARGRDARQPGRQDRDAGDYRHAHASEPDARGARHDDLRRRAYARRRRGDEPRSGHDRRVSYPGSRRRPRRAWRDSSPPGAASRRRNRDARPRHRWVTTTAEARKAVQEDAAKKVDIIKIWVDDRMGAVKKLSPELYTAVIDEAHKNGLRVIAHVYTLDDAKATLRAGLDAFAHWRARQGPGRRVHRAGETASRSGPRAEHARSRRGRRTSSGCGRAFPPRSSKRCRRATPIVRTRRLLEYSGAQSRRR